MRLWFCFTRCKTRLPASHCLLLTPFRYCSDRVPSLLSFSHRHTCTHTCARTQTYTESRTETRLIKIFLFAVTFSFLFPLLHPINSISTTSDKSDVVFSFCCSLPAVPPLSFHLSSMCIQCFPHTCPILCATPTLSHTPTHCYDIHTHKQTRSVRPQQGARRSCSSLFGSGGGPPKLIYHNSFSHTQNCDY